MKITKSYLKEIIKEELEKLIENPENIRQEVLSQLPSEVFDRLSDEKIEQLIKDGIANGDEPEQIAGEIYQMIR